MKRCITINKIVVTLLTIFVSISAYSQKAGGEIARVIPLVKKNYYGRPYKNNVVKKSVKRILKYKEAPQNIANFELLYIENKDNDTKIPIFLFSPKNGSFSPPENLVIY